MNETPIRKFFYGSTERNSVGYKVGERMDFNLEMLDESGNKLTCPKLKWILSSDDGSHSEGIASGETGKFSISTSISRAGFVRLQVTPADSDGNKIDGIEPFDGGACANFDEIRQSQPDPSDFDQYWLEQVELLNTFKPEIIEKVKVDGNPEFDIFDMKINSWGERPVSGYLSIPKNASERSLKAKLMFQGYSVVSANKNAEPDTIVFSVNAHGFENGREAEYYQQAADTYAKAFGFVREENKIPQTCYFRGMILRDLQAARFIKTLAEWNGHDLTASGGSMGSFQATSVAAHDADVSYLELNVPWMCDLGGVNVGKLKGWRPEPDSGIFYYDTAAQASRVKCPTVILQAGLGDYVCPPSSVTALYHNLKVKKQICYVQNREHGYTAPKYIDYKLCD